MVWCFLHDFHVILFLTATEDVYQFPGRERLTSEPMEEEFRNRLLYRLGIEDGPALLFQQGQVVDQIIDGLFSFQTPFMLCNTGSAKIDGYRFGRRLYRNLSAAKLTGHRIVVAVKTNGTETIYTAGTSLTGVKGILWKWIKLLLFLCQHGTNVIFLSTDLVGQILSAFFPEQTIQFFHRLHFGNRDAGVPSAVTYQAFHKALFISGCRVAENSFKSVVGSQSSIPGLFPGMSTEAIFDSNLAVVKDNPFGYTTEVLEYLNQGVQEAFFILPHVTPTRPISVAVLGSQSRIGCTTQAIQLWYFFTAIGYRAAIVANAAWLDELAALENSPYDDMVKIRGVVFVSENADTGDYNCIIRDWGVIDEVSKEAAADADLCVLVVGCKRWELVQTTNAIMDAGGMADLVMIAFGANQVAQQDIEKILLKASTPRQTALTRYTPEPFRPGLLDIFKPLLEALYDKGGI